MKPEREITGLKEPERENIGLKVASKGEDRTEGRSQKERKQD